MAKVFVFPFLATIAFALIANGASAQAPDPRVLGVENALNDLPACPSGPIQPGCFFGGINVNRNGLAVTTFLARVSAAGDERIDVAVAVWPDPATSQRQFKSFADQYQAPKSSPLWRTESFALSSGPSDSGVLEAWHDSNFANEGREAARLQGAFKCGDAVTNLDMFVTPAQNGPFGKDLVDAAQAQLKSLMQEFDGAFAGQGSCVALSGNRLQVDLALADRPNRDEIPYAEPTDFVVRVTAQDKANNSQLEPNKFAPVKVQFYLDGALVEEADTDSSGIARFKFQPPESIEQGRTPHIFKAVAAKLGFESGQRDLALRITRGLQQIGISVDSIEGIHNLGDTVTVSGRVSSLAHGLWMDPVNASVSVTGPLGGLGLANDTNENGFFSVPFTLDDQYLPEEGFIRVTVRARPKDTAKYEEGEVDVPIRASKKGDLQVSASTDRSLYGPDDTVQLFGSVTADNKPVAGSVEVQFENAVIGQATADSDGHFEYSFKPEAIRPSNSIGPMASGIYSIVLTAQAQGFQKSQRVTTYVTIRRPDPNCVEGQFTVDQISGNPTAHRIQPGSDEPAVQMARDNRFSHGIEVNTAGADRANLIFGLDGDSFAKVTLNTDTKIQVARYCRDSSGKVTLVLVTNDPGQIKVNVVSSDGAPRNHEILITTPAVEINDKNTQYLVNVEADGTTTIVVLEGVVIVSTPNGTDSVEVAAVNQITVRPGEGPNSANIGPLTGNPDPGLDSLSGARAPAANVPQPNLNASQMTLQAGRRGVIVNDTVSVPVWLIKGEQLANLNVDLEFDPDVVRVEGEPLKGNLLDNALFSVNPNSAGNLRLGLAVREGSVRGTGTIVVIPFRAVGQPGDRTPLEITVTTSNTPDGSALTIDRIAGEVLIVNPDGSVPPNSAGGTGSGGSSGSAVGGSGPAGSGSGPGLARGDCDGNGALTEIDALCALDMSVQLRSFQPLMDLDDSGDATSRDAVLILQQAVGN